MRDSDFLGIWGFSWGGKVCWIVYVECGNGGYIVWFFLSFWENVLDLWFFLYGVGFFVMSEVIFYKEDVSFLIRWVVFELGF